MSNEVDQRIPTTEPEVCMYCGKPHSSFVCHLIKSDEDQAEYEADNQRPVVGGPRVTLDDLLANYDPEKHRHPLIFDDAPIGREIL